MAGEVKAVSVMWTDIPEEVEHDLNEWYDREHIKNRVDIPGYLWGKRYRAVHGGPAYMALYATEGPHVQAGDEFLKVVANPTVGEMEFNPQFFNTIRMMCDVTASVGDAEGGFAGFLTVTPRKASQTRCDPISWTPPCRDFWRIMASWLPTCGSGMTRRRQWLRGGSRKATCRKV